MREDSIHLVGQLRGFLTHHVPVARSACRRGWPGYGHQPPRSRSRPRRVAMIPAGPYVKVLLDPMPEGRGHQGGHPVVGTGLGHELGWQRGSPPRCGENSLRMGHWQTRGRRIPLDVGDADLLGAVEHDALQPPVLKHFVPSRRRNSLAAETLVRQDPPARRVQWGRSFRSE